MKEIHKITNQPITLAVICRSLSDAISLELSKEVVEKVKRCRDYLDRKLVREDKPIYGINTGFGSLCDVKISKENLTQLQENLVMSHACGTGDMVPKHIVKLMLCLKIRSLGYGHSGIQLKTLQRLVDFYNEDVLPVVYEQGSLGASGDLAPLAHLALPLVGKGKVYHKGEVVPSEEILKKFNWKKIDLQPKEGLALLNGTQFMSAYGCYVLCKVQRLQELADFIGAISLEGFDCRLEPFNELVQRVRPHQGQLTTSRFILDLLKGSELPLVDKPQVQDPYSFRCIPQVHGATKDTVDFVTRTVMTEVNSVTDNPNIFVDEDRIISGGNFHGQPLALAMDYLTIALSELGSISERRTYQLVSGQRGLPDFLVHDPGLHSGLMIPQYAAASIVSQNKQLATPASVDSIVSSNGQEDHVSMGANSATKLLRVADNLERILAIELFTASQAFEFRRPRRSSSRVEEFLSRYRDTVSFAKQDRVFHDDIEKTIEFLKEVASSNS